MVNSSWYLTNLFECFCEYLRVNPSICPTSSSKSKKFFFLDFAHGPKFCNVFYYTFIILFYL